MKNLFFIIFFCTTMCAAAQTDSEKVLQRVQELNTAIFVAKDSNALESLVAARVSYGHSSGKIENRQEMIHGALSSGTIFSSVVIDTPVIYFQNKTAIVRHQLKANASDTTGRESIFHISILQVWVKQKGQWKLTARQAVKL